MKKYDRVKKEWITEDEYTRRQAKRSSCKGRRPHEYVEVLPFGAEATESYEGNPQPYYDTEKAIADFTDKKYEELEALGIRVKSRGYRWRPSHDTRPHMCTVCKKQTYL